MNVHLNARNVTVVVLSRAQFDKIERYKRRMGWNFTWLSSYASDFNHDFGVSFAADEQECVVYNFATLPPGRGDRPLGSW